MLEIEEIVREVASAVDPTLKHDKTVDQIEQVFRKYGFYTTREYSIFKMLDGSGRSGRIDLVARKGKYRVAVEYDHQLSIKYKSYQKIVQIKPEAAIAITGNGYLKPNLERAMKYKEAQKAPLYVISLKERRYELLGSYVGSGGSFKN